MADAPLQSRRNFILSLARNTAMGGLAVGTGYLAMKPAKALAECPPGTDCSASAAIWKKSFLAGTGTAQSKSICCFFYDGPRLWAFCLGRSRCRGARSLIRTTCAVTGVTVLAGPARRPASARVSRR